MGSGASGFMSAITAAKAGSKVVVLEKAGNLAAVNGVKVSGPFAVNTPVLRERGTTLTVNEVFQHVMNYTHWEPNSALIRNYLEHSSEAVENLLEIGYQFKEANFRFKTPFVDEKGGFHLILTDVDKRVRLWTEAYEKYGCSLIRQPKKF
ncbi:FAD-binding protein [Lactobacillus delbrueckii]|uniref:FAD-binding protein n=1 Tax=Lactobacillus delbrueckii TaxID=1584 RepID=UPI002150214E|nr:FAD-binding protein [Lactobacillus delbrueckii]